jgi:hypothetical protein
MEQPVRLRRALRLPAEPNPALVRHANERAQSVPKRNRRPDHRVRRLDVVHLHPHPLVRVLDRVRRRELPVRPADDDRLARGDLPLDLRQNRADAKRQAIADQQWQTVREEDEQNQELLALSHQILELAKTIHAVTTPRPAEGAPPLRDTAQTA